jgi:SAM-dependent methyltransferase
MSSAVKLKSDWLRALLGLARLPDEGEEATAHGRRLVMQDGILRARELVSAAQDQTKEAFGFKRKQRDSFESATSLARMREWLVTRYGDVAAAPWLTDNSLVLDAGCGAAMSALELFAPALDRIRYLGSDISDAVTVARARFAERGHAAEFVQADLFSVPLPPASVDVIFSEGVLHHTDSTEAALKSLARLLKPGGRFLFYVYRRKGPVREFTDDFIRERLQAMTPQDAWNALMPLTRLGKALGELQTEIEVPQAVELLGIPAGKIDVQRFFYWNFCKAFYRPDYTLEEMHNINFDLYAPRNAHRQSPEEVRRWCGEAGLAIERERVEEAGITIVARRS